MKDIVFKAAGVILGGLGDPPILKAVGTTLDRLELPLQSFTANVI